VLWLASCLLWGLGCSRSESSATPAPVQLDEARARASVATYADIAFAVYGDSLALARALDAAVVELVGAPSSETLRAAREAWLKARVPYVQSEAFRFYDGPIDGVEFWLNTWPIDENFVDTTDPTQPPGVIGDREHYPEINEALLLKLNGAASETSISTGYHVIEFLLWGRDESPEGPGARPPADFVGEPGSVQARRGEYLRVTTGLLVKQLAQVADAWDPRAQGNFRARFQALPVRRALGLMLKGMGALSGPELSGERLTVAYETKDQENEHSCFSDSTQRDMVGDALGVENLCLGRYHRRDGSELQGVGLCPLVQSVDPARGEELTRQIQASVAAARAIPEPFDQAILGADAAPGRRAILETIRALETQAASIARTAAALGVDLGLATAQAGKP